LGSQVRILSGSPFLIFPDGAAVAQLTVNQLVGGSNPSQGARTFMIEYALLGYALTIFIFFGWVIKDAKRYSPSFILAVTLFSLFWPIVLVVYLLDNKEA